MHYERYLYILFCLSVGKSFQSFFIPRNNIIISFYANYVIFYDVISLLQSKKGILLVD